MARDPHEAKRKPAQFKLEGARIWIPLSVLQGKAYSSLSISAKALLFDIAAQLRSDKKRGIYNNGDLTTAIKRLSERGWKSSKTIRRAAKELEKKTLIVKTRQGRLPNKANLYAITWYPLNEMPKLDVSANNFPLNGYVLFDDPPKINNQAKKKI